MRLNTYITYKLEVVKDLQNDLFMQANSKNIINLYCFDENDSVVDISGASVILMIKNNPTDKDEDAVINKIIIDLTDPTIGNTEVEVSAYDCKDLVGNYVYELRIALAESGNEFILSQGNICFTRSICGIN